MSLELFYLMDLFIRILSLMIVMCSLKFMRSVDLYLFYILLVYIKKIYGKCLAVARWIAADERASSCAGTD